MEDISTAKSTSPAKKYRFLPLMVSIETLGGIATPLVLRGTPLPTTRVRVFSTASDKQTAVEVRLSLGERPLAEMNLRLAEFTLSDIPQAPRGKPQIEVTIEIDQQCQVKASAIEKASGRKVSVESADIQIQLSDDKIRDMLHQAETYREEDQEAVKLAEAKSQAEATIHKAEQLLRDYRSWSDDQVRPSLEKAIAELGLALQDKDDSRIPNLYSELEDLCVKFEVAARAKMAQWSNSDLFAQLFGSPAKPTSQPAPKAKQQTPKAQLPKSMKSANPVAKKPSMQGITASSKRTEILAVFANPRGSDPLRLGAEDRVIHECIRFSRFRERIDLDVLHAATIHDVRRALLDKSYRIVHFSGHGTGVGLAFEDELGQIRIIPQNALAEFLGAYSPPIECVVLNACYSDNQSELLSLGIPYTIGMNGAISDEGATEFTRGFYDAIGAGKDIDFAYHEGCRTIKLMGLPEGLVPVLFKKRDQ